MVGSAEMGWLRLKPALLAFFALNACSANETNPFPKSLIEKFDEDTRKNIDAVDYQIHRIGDIRAFIIQLPAEYCGSGGCQTEIFVEQAGLYKKVYSDLAQGVTLKSVYPNIIEFRVERSGAVCGKKSNSEDCFINLQWAGNTKY